MYHLIAFKRNRALNVTLQKTATELMNKEQEKLMNVYKSVSARKAIDMVNNSGGNGVPLLKLTSVCSEDDIATLLKYAIIRIERTTKGMIVKFESKLTENVITRWNR